MCGLGATRLANDHIDYDDSRDAHNRENLVDLKGPGGAGLRQIPQHRACKAA